MIDQKRIDGLVKRCQDGDNEAFGEVYDIYLDEIYRFVFYKVSHKELAEDLTEDTFFKAWTKIDSYKKTDVKFSAWLYRIANNTIIDHLRKEKVHIEEIVEEIKDERMNTKDLTEESLNQQMLQRALKTLPDSQREVVILKYVNDQTNSEIAYTINKSETAVRTLLSRGIAKLKETIERFEAVQEEKNKKKL